MFAFKKTLYNIVLNVQKMSIFKSRSHIKNMFGFDKRFMSSKNDVVSNFIHVFAKMDGILITLYVISKNIHVSKNIRQFIIIIIFWKVEKRSNHRIFRIWCYGMFLNIYVGHWLAGHVYSSQWQHSVRCLRLWVRSFNSSFFLDFYSRLTNTGQFDVWEFHTPRNLASPAT